MEKFWTLLGSFDICSGHYLLFACAAKVKSQSGHSRFNRRSPNIIKYTYVGTLALVQVDISIFYTFLLLPSFSPSLLYFCPFASTLCSQTGGTWKCWLCLQQRSPCIFWSSSPNLLFVFCMPAKKSFAYLLWVMSHEEFPVTCCLVDVGGTFLRRLPRSIITTAGRA